MRRQEGLNPRGAISSSAAGGAKAQGPRSGVLRNLSRDPPARGPLAAQGTEDSRAGGAGGPQPRLLQALAARLPQASCAGIACPAACSPELLFWPPSCPLKPAPGIMGSALALPGPGSPTSQPLCSPATSPAAERPQHLGSAQFTFLNAWSVTAIPSQRATRVQVHRPQTTAFTGSRLRTAKQQLQTLRGKSMRLESCAQPRGLFRAGQETLPPCKGSERHAKLLKEPSKQKENQVLDARSNR